MRCSHARVHLFLDGTPQIFGYAMVSTDLTLVRGNGTGFFQRTEFSIEPLYSLDKERTIPAITGFSERSQDRFFRRCRRC